MGQAHPGMNPELLDASILASELQSVIATWLGEVECRGLEHGLGGTRADLVDLGPARVAREGGESGSWSEYERVGLWAAEGKISKAESTIFKAEKRHPGQKTRFPGEVKYTRSE